jgi:hypothetical protein
MRLNARREMGDAPLRRSESRGLVMVIFLSFHYSKVIGSLKTSQEPPSAARSPFFRFKTGFASDMPNLRHPETRPESLLPLVIHRAMVIYLL